LIENVKNLIFKFVIISIVLTQFSCSSNALLDDKEGENSGFNYNNEKGCDGKIYPDPNDSPYVLPFPSGTSVKTGLTNCSSSFHGKGQPDRYAFDFNVKEGTPFYAVRAGLVALVINDQPSEGGGSGNWLVIYHGDNTYGIYLHSPKDGISVEVGDQVKKGGFLGVTGKSGLAGYPHLHFIVVQNDYAWPYDPIPITFSNILPADVIVESNSIYKAGQY